MAEQIAEMDQPVKAITDREDKSLMKK